MLQMFLQQFVPAMEQVLTLAVPLGILFAILRRLPLEKYRRNYNTAIHWGFWLSVAIVAARVGTRNAVSREVAEAGAGVAVDTGIDLRSADSQPLIDEPPDDERSRRCSTCHLLRQTEDATADHRSDAECSQRGQRNLAGGDRPVPHINGPDVLSAIATHAPSQSHWHNTYLPYGTL